MDILRQAIAALCICVGISMAASYHKLYDHKLTMQPTHPVSLAFGEIANGNLNTLLQDRLIPLLSHIGQKGEDFIFINTLDTSNGCDRIKIKILKRRDITRFFPASLENKELSTKDMCIIPNEQILIYGFLKPGFKWVRNSGKYSPPLQWEELEILMIDDNQLEIIVDVYEKNIYLVGINRIEGYEQLPNDLVKSFFE